MGVNKNDQAKRDVKPKGAAKASCWSWNSNVWPGCNFADWSLSKTWNPSIAGGLTTPLGLTSFLVLDCYFLHSGCFRLGSILTWKPSISLWHSSFLFLLKETSGWTQVCSLLANMLILYSNNKQWALNSTLLLSSHSQYTSTYIYHICINTKVKYTKQQWTITKTCTSAFIYTHTIVESIVNGTYLTGHILADYMQFTKFLPTKIVLWIKTSYIIIWFHYKF